jgi:hypothetical protein
MKTENPKNSTIEEVLLAASNYDFTSTKTLHIDQEIHRKFKSILVDYNQENVTMKKLVNVILFQWIENHKAELEGKLIEKMRKGY